MQVSVAASLASILELEVERVPVPDARHPEPWTVWRNWLAQRGLAIVPVSDPASFKWPGPWLALLDAADGEGHHHTNMSAGYHLVMLVLSLYAIAALAAEAAMRLDPQIRVVLSYADYSVCALFAADFCISLWRAPHRLRYLSTWGWLDLLSSVPVLSVARWGRVARVARVFRVLRGIKATKEISAVLLQQRARNTVVDPRFPGFADLGSGFEMMEEWYSLKDFSDDLHVLLVQETGTMEGIEYQRGPYPATWARMHGSGRVFYTSMGHRDDVWASHNTRSPRPTPRSAST